MEKNRTGIIAAYVLLLMFGLGFIVRYSGLSLIGVKQTQVAFSKIMDQSGDSQALYEEALRRLGDRAEITKQQQVLGILASMSAYRAVRQVASHLLSQPDIANDKVNRRMLLSMRGAASLETGYMKEGLADYEANWKANSSEAKAKNDLAYALVLNKVDLDRAEGLAAQAYNSENNASFADTLGWIAIYQGNYSKGLQLLLDASGDVPDAYEVRYHAGVAYWATGDYAKAATELTMAIKLYKTNRRGTNSAYQAVLDLVNAKTPFRTELIP